MVLSAHNFVQRVRLLALLFLLNTSLATAWSDHATLVWLVLSDVPELHTTLVTARSLADFVSENAEALEVVLEEHESTWVSQHPEYSAVPETLYFDPDIARQDPVPAFLAAIRVNPTLDYGLVRRTDLAAQDAPRDLSFSDVSFLSAGDATGSITYAPLEEGETVSAAVVLASASDEPDQGMDVGLFEDNGTAFGQRYGFGVQPFGNPNLDYGSQAPFHMGFFHLDALTKWAQPGLLQTYPHYRVSLYLALAQLAFEKDHAYWGWRFLGWALHYIGDLSQPYHAEPLPGVSTPQAIWLVMQGKTNQAVQLVSNRHGVLESYQYHRIQAVRQDDDSAHPLLQALRSDDGADYSADWLMTVVAARSVAAAATLDTELAETVPNQFVNDPDFEWTGSGFESDIVKRVEASGGAEAVERLDRAVSDQLTRFADHVRTWVRVGQSLSECASMSSSNCSNSP
jgi:hypothetical protein